jgi:pyridinium-3,5-bisthiocarboxylic acid mononucleotide nickel chelatase
VIVWLNPVAGVSGDMLLGALLDLGAPLDAVLDALAPLHLPGVGVSAEYTQRQGLRARRAVVRIDDDATHRPAAVLLDLVARATPQAVADLATEAVRALAETEAAIHRQPVSDVHLHEVGGLDTVIDTVGVAAAAHALGVTCVYSAPIALGTGTVRSAHGLLPVPAPATIALLAGAEVYGAGPVGETVTPTGAALLSALGCRYEPPPPMTVRRVGYGAGARDPAGRPNVLPAVLAEPSNAGDSRESLTLLETTVDDVTGEAIGAAIERLLHAGAVDAWATAATGKKGRPALVVSVLAGPAHADTLVEVLARWTGTLGVRLTPVERHALPRQTVEVEVGGHRVRVKVGPYGAKPEHDDVLAVSRALDRPPATVVAAALAELREARPANGRRRSPDLW